MQFRRFFCLIEMIVVSVFTGITVIFFRMIKYHQNHGYRSILHRAY